MGMKERGFTIIEVALFLAISGALILLTIGLWSMVARQRFNDTMTTLRSTFQSEYEEVRTSINERLGSVEVTGCKNDITGLPSSNNTGNSECLVIGKLVQFVPGDSDVKISYVVAKGANVALQDKGDVDALREISKAGNLLVIGDARSDSTTNGYGVKSEDVAVLPKTIRLEWGGEFMTSWTVVREKSTSATVNLIKSNALAILHSPTSGAVLVFSFKTTNPVNSVGALSLTEANAEINRPVAVLVKNNQPGYAGGAICIDGGTSSVAVRQIIVPDGQTNGFDAVDPLKPKADLICEF